MFLFSRLTEAQEAQEKCLPTGCEELDSKTCVTESLLEFGVCLSLGNSGMSESRLIT